MKGMNALRKGTLERSLALFYDVRTQREDSHLQTRKQDVTRHGISWYFDFRFCSFQNCEKSLLLKPPS